MFLEHKRVGLWDATCQRRTRLLTLDVACSDAVYTVGAWTDQPLACSASHIQERLGASAALLMAVVLVSGC